MFVQQLQQDSSSDEWSEAYESSSDDEIVSNDDLCQLCFEKYPPTKKPIKRSAGSNVTFVINGTIKTA